MLCRHFKCKEESNECLECYNGVCPGTGFDGHQRCGCELCEYHIMKEDVEDCTYEDKKESIEFNT